MQIEVIDLGISNSGSVVNMIKRTGHEASVVRYPTDSIGPHWLVLPGVGAYDAGVSRLRESGWYDLLVSRQCSGRVLGICLGMQLLCEGSDEGEQPGLGLVPGRFRRFSAPSGERLDVPHMGWNVVDFVQSKNAAFAGLPQESRFYFVHSYRYENDSDEFIAGWTNYGCRFASVVQSDSAIGFQFHPEKSHRFGLCLLKALFDSPC